MSLSMIRLEDITLHNYIKYEVLGYDFIEQLANQTLTYDTELALYVPDMGNLEPAPNSLGRGWVPFDEISGTVDVSQEQVSRVSVVGPTSYDVNYGLCGIGSPNTVPSTVSYYWNYISVMKGWPGTDPPELPIVAIDIVRARKTGFQLGGGNLTTRFVEIHLFATNSSERADISEAIHDALYNKAIPIVDYSAGDYLDYDGLFDSTFSRQQVAGTSALMFDDVALRNINMPNDWSDLNKFRAVISFNMSYYKY